MYKGYLNTALGKELVAVKTGKGYIHLATENIKFFLGDPWLLIMPFILWGYLGWRLIIKTAPYLMCCRSHTNADGIGYVSLLYSSPKEMNFGVTNLTLTVNFS